MAQSLDGWTADTSPFHEGERSLQAHVGKRDRMEQFGRRVIRDYLPDQHRSFYEGLRHLFVGSVDADGDVWASLVSGAPGFISSPTDRLLSVRGRIPEGDPLAANLSEGAALGFLGLEFESRRRNRMNGRAVQVDEGGFLVGVDQAFGNCPQYIQTRSLASETEPAEAAQNDVVQFDSLSEVHRRWISEADTFFVASAVLAQEDARVDGVDVSHRGGRTGFVKVAGNRLLVPDFSGNNHFNTLGNFIVNPKAGLLFADFEAGDLLMLSGHVEVHLDKAAFAEFEGAERFWSFELKKGLELRGALSQRWAFGEASPRNERTGVWT